MSDKLDLTDLYDNHQRPTFVMDWGFAPFRSEPVVRFVPPPPPTRLERVRAAIADAICSGLGYVAPTFPLIGWYIGTFIIAPLVLHAMGR